MAFLKSLLSKVTIAVAAGAAEQSVRHAVSDAWNKRKQAKGEKADEALGTPDTKPVNPVSRWFSEKLDQIRDQRLAKEYVSRSPANEETETPDPEDA